jgi:hypothetical protein
MTDHFEVRVIDDDQARAIADKVSIGHYFIFVRDRLAMAGRGRRGRLRSHELGETNIILPLARPSGS